MPKHLLMADDSVTIRKVVEMTFAGEGFEVTTVGDGEELLAQARQRKPDVVLADAAMPRMDGYQACEALKADPSLSDVPVLLLAGTFEAFDEARARAAGAEGHIAKPFETQALIGRVRGLAGLPVPSASAHPSAPAPGRSTSPAPHRVQPAVAPAAAAPLGPFPTPSRPPLPPRPTAAPASAALPPRPPPLAAEPWSTLAPPAPAPIPPRPRAPVAPVAQPAARAPAPPAPPGAADLDWSDLTAPEPAPSAPAAAVPAFEPPTIAGAPTVSLDALDFGEPSAFAEAPRGDLALEEEEPEILDLPLIDLDEELVEELEPAPPVTSALAFTRAPAAPFAVLAPAAAAPQLAPAGAAAPVTPGDGGEAALREALSRASREVIERIAWEVVPQLAEVIVREHVERLARSRQGP